MPITLRRVLVFLVLGAGLLTVRSWWQAEPERQAIELSMASIQAEEQRWLSRWGHRPDDAERAAIIRTEADEEVLFREALRAGLHRSDPVVLMRLVRNMRFVDENGSTTDQSLPQILEQAYLLDMHKSDIVVRRRMVQVMHNRMLTSAKPSEPSPELVREYIKSNAKRFETEAQISFTHIYINPRRAGWSKSAAAALLEKLRSDAIAPVDGIRLGDPIPMARQFAFATTRDLTKRFGTDFADALSHAAVGAWSGPYTTMLGEHLVWVEAMRPATLVFDDKTLTRARRAIMLRRKEALVDGALAKLREDYRIRIQSAGVLDGQAASNS